MAHFGTGVEYALHCLLWLAEPRAEFVSSRDLAELQGVPAPFMAKLFPKLEKAGIVSAGEGINGGYRLAKPAEQISVLDVVDAIEGPKPLFDCQDVRARCALFEGDPPKWATSGVCGIHAVMLRAESAMRDELAKTTIASLASNVARKVPASFERQVVTWIGSRIGARNDARIAAITARAKSRRRRA